MRMYSSILSWLSKCRYAFITTNFFYSMTQSSAVCGCSFDLEVQLRSCRVFSHYCYFLLFWQYCSGYYSLDNSKFFPAGFLAHKFCYYVILPLLLIWFRYSPMHLITYSLPFRPKYWNPYHLQLIQMHTSFGLEGQKQLHLY